MLKETAEHPPSSHTSSNSHATQANSPTTSFKRWLPQSTKKSLNETLLTTDPSLTCILCKVIEHIIVSNIWKHLHKHDIILHFQHGFQSGLSCESQLIATVHDWMTALENETQIDAILLNFAIALDKVPHKRLLSKLTSYGITGNTHNLITYYLQNRKQRVSVNGALSDITYVASGVPQGSVLRHILFLLYSNDKNGNVKSRIRLFADYSIIYCKIISNIDHQILQTDLIQLDKWSDKWQMQFNISKCAHLQITNKTKPSSHQYSLFGHPLSKVTSHAYLGVKLDSNISPKLPHNRQKS